MKKLLLLCSTAACFMPAAAFAQSTGTQATEEEPEAIVITATRTNNGVDGVVVPDTTKAKGLITSELIQKQSPGQTVLNVINLVPSVNFTNSDPFGNSGGNIRIRGFDGNRISLTFDGVPLNDSGNYAIFSSQLLDAELIEQVNVGLGVTDVDSPTASAAGGTVNYRAIIPSNDMGGRITLAAGDWKFRRAFGLFQTGRLTSFGTKAWVSASIAQNDKFKGPGEIKKTQYNARIYQPMGSRGDFISIAANYNNARNNFYRNPSITDLRAVLGATEIPATPSQTPAGTFNPTPDDPFEIGYFNEAQEYAVFEFENLAKCNRTVAGPGAQNDGGGTGANGSGANAPALPTPLDGGANYGSTQNNPSNAASCTNFYDVRINPSRTGNLRGQMRLTLSDQFLFTMDPSFQYVLAHGGGSTTLAENSTRAKGGVAGSPGVDYNGDGDFADTIRFFTPNITNTHRYGLTSSLIFDPSPEHRVRVAYTFDNARHRQTGQWGYLDALGSPEDDFSGRNGRKVLTAAGYPIQQRNRLSFALLNQISGQYIGKFFDNALRVEVGVRRPFFLRKLETFCPIEARGSGFGYCTSEPLSSLKIIGPDEAVPATGPTPYYAPFSARYKYGKLLPNVGFTYRVIEPVSIFGSFAKGFSAPRTDNLYRAPVVTVKPEETNSFDLGARYTTRRVQGQLAAWKIDYSNRIVSSFNQDLGISLDRNVGKVKTWGIDGSLAFRPIPQLSLLGLASYIKAELQENIEIATATYNAALATQVAPAGLIFCGAAPTAATPTVTTCAETRGKMVSETPKLQYGGRANLDLGVLSMGLQAKRVGTRFATDLNDVKVKGYTMVDFDMRVSAEPIGLKKTYLQVNVTNLTDEFYFGNLSTQIRASDNPNFAVGSPRTFMASLNIGF